jgi:hypothetical protein
MRRRCTLARHRAQDQEADQEAAKGRRSGSGWPERGGAIGAAATYWREAALKPHNKPRIRK